MKVLFVCRGNAARSQMAAVLYNRLTNSKDASSAGTLINPAKSSLPEDVVKVLGEQQLDVSQEHRRPISLALAQKVDKIILMTDEHVPDYLQNNPKVTVWHIDDPRGLGEAAHRKTRDEIRAEVEKLIKKTG